MLNKWVYYAFFEKEYPSISPFFANVAGGTFPLYTAVQGEIDWPQSSFKVMFGVLFISWPTISTKLTVSVYWESVLYLFQQIPTHFYRHIEQLLLVQPLNEGKFYLIVQ